MSGDETTLVDMHRMDDTDHVTRIDRRTEFGNPFKLKRDGGSHTLEESIRRYTVWFYDLLDRDPEFKAAVEDLEGETLGCWCIDTKDACHGEVILDYLNDGDDDVSPAEARQRFADRLTEAGVAADRFIDVHDGEKRSTDHTQYGADTDRLSGNYGVYAGGDQGRYLVDIDVDDYNGDIDQAELDAVEALPPTFAVESPHTDGDNPGHRYYAVTADPTEIVRDVTGDDKDNFIMSCGEIKIKNQYVVGPGSQIEKGPHGCDKDWCDDCADPDGGRYRIGNNRPIAELSESQFRDLVKTAHSGGSSTGESVGTVDEETAGEIAGGVFDVLEAGKSSAGTSSDGGENPDLTDEEVIEKAKAAKNGDDFKALWDGSTAGHKNDHSRARMALLCHLAYWTGKDNDQMDQMYCDSGLHPHPEKPDKWGRVGKSEIQKAIRKTSDVYTVGGQAPDDALDTAIDVIGGETTMPDERKAVKTFVSALAHAVDDGYPQDDAVPMCKAVSARADYYTKKEIAGKLDDALEEIAEEERDNEGPTWALAQSQYSDDDHADSDVGRDAAVKLTMDEDTFVTHRESLHTYVYTPERGVFVGGGEERIREILADGLEHRSKRRRVENIIYEIQTRTFERTDALGGPDGYVCVDNGVLDVRTRDLDLHSPEHLFLSDLGTEYDESADCPEWLAFIEDVVSHDDRAKLQEYAGYCLMHWNQPYKKALFLQGPQDSGKSTFLSVLSSILGGRDNVAGETLHSIVDTRWGAARLFGTYANIYNDIDDTDLEQPGRFKALTGNDDSVTAERKHEDKFEFEPTQKLLFSANQFPKVQGADEVFHDRWIHVSFPDSVPVAEQDEDLRGRLLDESAGILNWMLDGLDRLREQGHFTNERTVDRKRDLWESFGDPVLRFKQRRLEVTGSHEDTVPTAVMQDEYAKFCSKRKLPTRKPGAITRTLTDDERIERTRRQVDGEREYVYTGVSLVDEHNWTAPSERDGAKPGVIGSDEQETVADGGEEKP